MTDWRAHERQNAATFDRHTVRARRAVIRSKAIIAGKRRTLWRELGNEIIKEALLLGILRHLFRRRSH